MPRQAKAAQAKKSNKTNGRKRKSEVLNPESIEVATSDTDEGIVLIAKQVAARVKNRQPCFFASLC